MMVKMSLRLIFVLQIYVSVESLTEEGDLLDIICNYFNYTLFILLFGKTSSCEHGKLALF